MMATTHADKVGRIRERLAERLNEAIPTAVFLPEELDTQTGRWAQQGYSGGGLCRWYGDGHDKETGIVVHVACWETMRDCARFGIKVASSDPHTSSRFSWDVYGNPDPELRLGSGFGLPS